MINILAPSPPTFRICKYTKNGTHYFRSIEVIQEWCEGLADIIWSLKQQVKQLQTLRDKIQDPQNPDVKPNLLMEITTLLYNLVKSTFIIEKQPPQVCGLFTLKN